MSVYASAIASTKELIEQRGHLPLRIMAVPTVQETENLWANSAVAKLNLLL
jgi:hypothetical protein